MPSNIKIIHEREKQDINTIRNATKAVALIQDA